jgi:hypothetical protein
MRFGVKMFVYTEGLNGPISNRKQHSNVHLGDEIVDRFKK